MSPSTAPSPRERWKNREKREKIFGDTKIEVQEDPKDRLEEARIRGVRYAQLLKTPEGLEEVARRKAVLRTVVDKEFPFVMGSGNAGNWEKQNAQRVDQYLTDRNDQSIDFSYRRSLEAQGLAKEKIDEQMGLFAAEVGELREALQFNQNPESFHGRDEDVFQEMMGGWNSISHSSLRRDTTSPESA